MRKKVNPHVNGWVWLWSGMLHDMKVWALDDESFRTWILLLSLCDEEGCLQEITLTAFMLRTTVAELQQRIDRLIAAELIRRRPGGKHGVFYILDTSMLSRRYQEREPPLAGPGDREIEDYLFTPSDNPEEELERQNELRRLERLASGEEPTA